MDRPDAAALLLAVARFLEKDARQAIQDPGLSFRVLIAANLCKVAAADRQAEGELLRKERARLEALLFDAEPAPAPSRSLEPEPSEVERLRAYHRTLAERIRSGAISAAQLSEVRTALRATLAEAIRVQNPRFDLSEQIEGSDGL
jgi:hypothetical protein